MSAQITAVAEALDARARELTNENMVVLSAALRLFALHLVTSKVPEVSWEELTSAAVDEMEQTIAAAISLVEEGRAGA